MSIKKLPCHFAAEVIYNASWQTKITSSYLKTGASCCLPWFLCLKREMHWQRWPWFCSTQLGYYKNNLSLLPKNNEWWRWWIQEETVHWSKSLEEPESPEHHWLPLIYTQRWCSLPDDGKRRPFLGWHNWKKRRDGLGAIPSHSYLEGRLICTHICFLHEQA